MLLQFHDMLQWLCCEQVLDLVRKIEAPRQSYSNSGSYTLILASVIVITIKLPWLCMNEQALDLLGKMRRSTTDYQNQSLLRF
jgi:hypothetical protein